MPRTPWGTIETSRAGCLTKLDGHQKPKQSSPRMTQETHSTHSKAADGRDGFVRSIVVDVDVLLLIVSLVSVVLIGTATG